MGFIEVGWEKGLLLRTKVLLTYIHNDICIASIYSTVLVTMTCTFGDVAGQRSRVHNLYLQRTAR